MSADVVLVGFCIAVAIGLTGIGAGILTAPLLMTIFHVPTAAAVGTALTFGVVTKVLTIPAYAARRQIHWRFVLQLLIGGLPGVLLGSLILARIDSHRYEALISTLLGTAIVVFASLSLCRYAQPARHEVSRDRPWSLTAIAIPIGAEVGFSSAGSGSLTSLALMALTRLPTATIVGTDICFGLGISLVGGGILLGGGHYDPVILPQLLVGGIAGALLAPTIAAYIPARPLRLGVLLGVVAIGGNLVLRGLAR